MVSFAVAVSAFRNQSNIGCSLFLAGSGEAANLDKLARRWQGRTSTVGTSPGLEGGRAFSSVGMVNFHPPLFYLNLA